MKRFENDPGAELVELVQKMEQDSRTKAEQAKAKWLRNKPAPKAKADKSAEEKEKRKHGEGSLYRQLPSKNWHIAYYRADGKRVKESTKTDDRKKAERILQDRLVSVRRGEVVETAKVKISKLYEDWLQWVTVNQNERGSRSVEELGWRWKHLSPVFGHLRAVALSTPSLVAYRGMRQREGAQNSTVNREMASLRKILYYGVETHRIKALPCTFTMLKENPARQDFIELAEFKLLIDGATGWMRTFLELAFSYGWRKSEILGLRIQQVNFSARTIRLNPGTTKNGEGREVAMTSKVEELLREAVKGREKNKSDYVLVRENGKPIKEFRAAWRKLTAAAGVPDLLVHGLRRSAAHALRAAGIPESLIMKTGGWLTEDVFRRYAISSGSDRQQVVDMMEAARERSGLFLVPDLNKGEEKAG